VQIVGSIVCMSGTIARYRNENTQTLIMPNHDAKSVKVTYKKYVNKRDLNRTKCGFCLLREGFPKKLPYILKCFYASNDMYKFLFKNKN
jgi:hypothetical protein